MDAITAAEIRAQHKAKLKSLAQLAREHHCSKSLIQKICDGTRWGEHPRGRYSKSPETMRPERIRAIQSARGLTSAEMAAALGVSDRTYRSYLRPPEEQWHRWPGTKVTKLLEEMEAAQEG